MRRTASLTAFPSAFLPASFGMTAFIVVVIGGIGSFWGAVVGGLLVGLVSGLSNLVIPRGSIMVMYVLMTVVLLLRPRGLAGQKSMLEL